jgi:hypothetical protein
MACAFFTWRINSKYKTHVNKPSPGSTSFKHWRVDKVRVDAGGEYIVVLPATQFHLQALHVAGQRELGGRIFGRPVQSHHPQHRVNAHDVPVVVCLHGWQERTDTLQRNKCNMKTRCRGTSEKVMLVTSNVYSNNMPGPAVT